MDYIGLIMATQTLDQRAGFIWHNGEIKEWAATNVHVMTHGLHYGTSAFEGIRIYNGKAFRLQEHMERLIYSAEQIHLKVPYSVKELMAATEELIKINHLNSGYIRPLTYKGAEESLVAGTKCTVNVAIAAWSAFENNRQQLNQKGINATISTWRKAPIDVMPANTKTSGLYMMLHTVKNDASAKGFDDALMLDMHDYLTEATTSNLFFIKSNQLHTPAPDCFLNGITRQEIIKIAKHTGVEVVERHIHVSEYNSFDAAFLTGTAIEMSPIASITYNGEKYEYALGHPLYMQLLHAFHEVTSEMCIID